MPAKKHATEKQLLANRRNAQLSTGPRTEQGKRASSLNAWRHGLTGQIQVLTSEEKEIHDNFCAGIVDALHPIGALEAQLAQSVAEGHWRLNRARAIENNIFTLAASFEDAPAGLEPTEVDKALAAARAFIADPARFQLLTIYEMRIHRKTRSDLDQLRAIQTERRAAADAETARLKAAEDARRAEALADARLLIEYEDAPAGHPAEFQHPNGFVFSTAAILDSIHFEQRLDRARQAAASAHPASRPGRSAIHRAA